MINDYFARLLDLFVSPITLAVIPVVLVALRESPRRQWVRWVPVVVAILFSGVLDQEEAAAALSFPFSRVVPYGRPITVCAIAAILVLAAQLPRTLPGPVSSATLTVYLFHAYMAFRLWMSDAFSSKGLATIALLPLLFWSMSVGVARFGSFERRWFGLVCSLALAPALSVLFVYTQLAIKPSAVIAHGRLFGLTFNPQPLAMATALGVAPMLHLRDQSLHRASTRIAATGSLIACVVTILWTGSRTGLLAASVGTAVYYRDRMSNLVAISVLLGITSVGIAMSLDEMGFAGSLAPDMDRFLAGRDTRSAVWNRSLFFFQQAPVFGSPDMAQSPGESSYLGALAFGGVVAGFLCGLAALQTGLLLVRTSRLTDSGPERRKCNFLCAMFSSIAVIGVFEMVLLAPLSSATLVLLCCLRLLDDLSHKQHAPVLSPKSIGVSTAPYSGLRPPFSKPS